MPCYRTRGPGFPWRKTEKGPGVTPPPPGALRPLAEPPLASGQRSSSLKAGLFPRTAGLRARLWLRPLATGPRSHGSGRSGPAGGALQEGVPRSPLPSRRSLDTVPRMQSRRGCHRPVPEAGPPWGRRGHTELACVTRQWARAACAAGHSVGPTFSVKGGGSWAPASSFTGTPPTKAGPADMQPNRVTPGGCPTL